MDLEEYKLLEKSWTSERKQVNVQYRPAVAENRDVEVKELNINLPLDITVKTFK